MLRLSDSLTTRRLWTWAAACALALGSVISFLQPVAAQEETKTKRPAIEDLLPETTVVFVEITDIRELVVKLKEANVGRLLQEESIAPLVTDLYQQATDAFDGLTRDNGIDLTASEIFSLPGGEINIAVIAPKRKTPVFLFTFEINQDNENLNKLLTMARDAAEDNGAEMETATVEDVEFETIVSDGNRVTYFQKDGVVVASNSEKELTAYLDRWLGKEVEKVRPLSKNRKFVTIMNRCRGTKELPPDLRFYVDPIELARSGFRGNMGAQAAMNFLPVLGLDGLLAVGGSSIMFEGEFESVFHGHMLLANPRKGLFEMIALKPSTYEPPSWVPDRSILYVSTSWDVPKMLSEIEKMVDTFQGEGNFQEEVLNKIDEEMGEGFFDNLLGSVTGRFTFVQWSEKDSMAINAEIPVLAIELSEDHKFIDILDSILDKIADEGDGADVLTEKEYHGVKYWTVAEEQIQEQQDRTKERLNRRLNERLNEGDEDGDLSIELRADQPAFAVIGNSLIICSSPAFIEIAIDTERGDSPSLMENEEFQSVAKSISKLAGSDMPSVFFFQQPAETLRHYYKLVQGDNARNMLSSFASENDYAANVERALDENPLPPFSELEKYFRPTGSFVVSDDTGYHFLAFQVKADDDGDKEDK